MICMICKKEFEIELIHNWCESCTKNYREGYVAMYGDKYEKLAAWFNEGKE